jgi:hypothetical protein
MQPRQSQRTRCRVERPGAGERSRQRLSANVFRHSGQSKACSRVELVVLDVLLDEGESLGVLAVVLDGDRGAALHLAGFSFLVIFAVAEPFAELFSGLNVDQGDLVGLSQSLQTRLISQKHLQ